MNPSAPPVWRSLLYVPAHVERFVAKAHLRGADAIQLDLEDSVPASEKDEARRGVPGAAALVARGGADVVVRINRPWRLSLRDLEAVICPDVQAVALPKVDSADHVRMADEVMSELESERGMAAGSTRIIAMVETAAGFFQVDGIATSSPRVAALTLGSEDFAVELGVEPDPDVMAYPKQQVVIAARAAGVSPIGLVGTLAGFDDLAGFREVVRRSRRLGCEGASAIHPGQVPILNEEFSPSPAEVEHAKRVVDEYDAAVADGRGAVAVDGKMVDVPVVVRARRLLDRHRRILDRDADRQG